MRRQKADMYNPAYREPQPDRVCDHPTCKLEGAHRAPRSRAQLDEFYWFCQDHAREYNAAWNFFAGMSDDEVEESIENATVWDRPTWPFGSLHGDPTRAAEKKFQKLFSDVHEDGTPKASWEPHAQAAAFSKEEHKALRVLDLDLPVTLDRIKTRYKELAKRHHPDANGGDKDAEEKLKTINGAYTTLRKSANL